MALVTDGKGSPLLIEVPLRGRNVVAQIWRVEIGRVPLFLLDVDRPENSSVDRWIGSRLYDGDDEVRLSQNALLGIGGVRALHALGLDPAVWHLNEGAAALAPLELARGSRARVSPSPTPWSRHAAGRWSRPTRRFRRATESFALGTLRKVLSGWLASPGRPRAT